MYRATASQEQIAQATSQLDQLHGSYSEQLQNIKDTRSLIARVTRLAIHGSAYSIFDGSLRQIDPEGIFGDNKYSLRETESKSRVYPLPTDEGSAAMGATATAFRHGIHKDSFFGDWDSVGVITSADIKVGVIPEDAKRTGINTPLLATETVMRVTVHPPEVYYDNDASGLRAIKPGTEDWVAAEGLVSIIEKQTADTSR